MAHFLRTPVVDWLFYSTNFSDKLSFIIFWLDALQVMLGKHCGPIFRIFGLDFCPSQNDFPPQFWHGDWTTGWIPIQSWSRSFFLTQELKKKTLKELRGDRSGGSRAGDRSVWEQGGFSKGNLKSPSKQGNAALVMPRAWSSFEVGPLVRLRPCQLLCQQGRYPCVAPGSQKKERRK